MKAVTDPALLEQLESESINTGLKPVTDPDIISQLEQPEPRKSYGVTGTWESDFPSSKEITQEMLQTIPISRTQEAIQRLGKAAGNAPSDFYNYGKAIVSSVKPSKESYYIPGGEVVRGATNLATGAVQKLIPGEQSKEPYAEAFGKWVKDTHGSWENFKNYATEHPVQAASEISTMFSLGGTAATKLAPLFGTTLPAKTGAVTAPLTTAQRIKEAGEKAAQFGRKTEPINLAISAAKPIANTTGKFISQVLGRITTGAGSEAIKQAFDANPDFIKALRGETSNEQIIGNARTALNQMKSDRGMQYTQQLNKIKEANKVVDITPIKNKFAEMLLRFKVKPTPEGGLDFSRSRIVSSADQANINEIANVLKDWGSKPGDLLATNVDTLKQILGEYYSPNHNIEAIVSATYNKARRVLVDNVPGYEKLVGDYEKQTNIINEMKKSLSLNNKAMMDTTLKKLLSTMRENFEWRRGLVDKLEEASGQNLKAQIAGVTMQSYLPKGLVGKMDAGALAYLTYIHGIDPMLGSALLLSSPRLTGEFLYMLGKTKQQMAKIPITSKAATIGRQIAYPLGSIQNEGGDLVEEKRQKEE